MTALARKFKASCSTASWHLALDKYPFRLDDDGMPSMSTAPDQRGNTISIKYEHLRKVRDFFKSAQNQTHLQQVIDSRLAFLRTLERQHGPCFRRITLINTSRLLLHLGRTSVLENVGLYCDRATGLPLIPGTAVKGVVSNWACWEGWYGVELNPDSPPLPPNLTRSEYKQLPDTETNLAIRILGSDDTSKPHRGEVAFLSAVPNTVPVIGLDIITPHTSPAGQEQSPVPNPFLCIEPGTAWDFVFVAGVDSAEGKISSLLDTVQRWLIESLEQSGIGAKSASGYGKFLRADEWKNLILDEKSLLAFAAEEHKKLLRVEAFEARRAEAIGDYQNEKVFQNLVLGRLGKPNEYQLLQQEIGRILSNPENQPWIEKITATLRDNKDTRKRLKEKDWFPKEWHPQ